MDYLTKFLIFYSIACTIFLLSSSLLCSAMCFILTICNNVFKNVRKYTSSHTEVACQPLSNEYIES